MTDRQALTVKCPTCDTPVVWSEQSVHRPFCSERCRNQDFIAWANQEQVIGGSGDYDDFLSDDLQRD